MNYAENLRSLGETESSSHTFYFSEHVFKINKKKSKKIINVIILCMETP